MIAIFGSVSLLLASASSVSWIRSYRGANHDRVTWRMGGDRYTLHAMQGSVALKASPRPLGTREQREAILRLTRQLANGDLFWHVDASWDHRTASDAGGVKLHSWSGSVDGVRVALELRAVPKAMLASPLLDALEDKDRFAAAHLLLLRTAHPNSWRSSQVQRGDSILHDEWGLEVELRPAIPMPEEDAPITIGDTTIRRAPRPVYLVCRGSPSVRIDPAQLPRIRQQWHDLLDVQILSVPHWAVVGVLLVPPTLWGWGWWRRARLAKAGHCLHCGYDLRASTCRCPECGNAIEQTPAA